MNLLKIYLDPGHGGSDPGASGNGLNEKDITLDIARKVNDFLIKNYENVSVKMSRSTDIAKSLNERTREANSWGADLFLSIHCNAANGKARGYEDFIYTSLSSSSKTAKYQNILHQEVMKVNQLPDRGKKKANFHVLRETKMAAILTENGFIDNEKDAALMRQSSWREAVARGHAAGLALALGLKAKKKSDQIDAGLYRIIAGSFKSRSGANERAAFLKDKGIAAIVIEENVSGSVWSRVQAGAFESRENAEDMLKAIKNAGIPDAFIASVNIPVSTELSQGYSIAGKTVLSPEMMNQFVKKVNPQAINLGYYYSAFGDHYGIRGDVAFAQALHETNYFRFTGDVNSKQNNFAGLGATGNGASGASFKTPREGVLAHIQHLYAYASTNSLPPGYPLADPRFNLVKKGSARTWTDLNGKWAVPGDQYGELIINLYQAMVKEAKGMLDGVLKEIDKR
ncbi:N-acetylmuramoyl-L-alanine amidase [Cytobacillus firmus]